MPGFLHLDSTDIQARPSVVRVVPALQDTGQLPWPLPTRRQEHPPTTYANSTCAQTLPSVPSGTKSPWWKPLLYGQSRAPYVPAQGSAHHRKLNKEGHMTCGHPPHGSLFLGDLRLECGQVFAPGWACGLPISSPTHSHETQATRSLSVSHLAHP